jgi:hypothetical protein
MPANANGIAQISSITTLGGSGLRSISAAAPDNHTAASTLRPNTTQYVPVPPRASTHQ